MNGMRLLTLVLVIDAITKFKYVILKVRVSLKG